MIFGYARESTEEQKLDIQVDALAQFGVEKIYKEKLTGTRKDSPQLEELLKVLRSGDKIVVYKLDRFSRSTKHLIELSELFIDLEVDFVSITDSIDTSTAMGKFFFRTMASISERTKSGLQAARSRGRKGGRPTKKKDKVEMAIKMYKSKDYTINQITEATGIARTCFNSCLWK
ncbi:recombinase family protein [Cytobacillus horneckiae]|uniref:Recombinase family protein n=1 Tax=Cytobacillus horneckiae TaxID=549687 RepID=A0A2N0ZL99_9BACI|nr:recombinase family protein [Cytobacillus horneckiae]MBN6885725.1 recombinase family protein [Cytobacillus horneckiae]MCM3177273.1 recombinase family protein [Cytobacillus horneckiae]MEC1156166.1 recombinase family protein [Cytobacillus horneckiae]MED2938183.1 recombinase family protein [Cytobacillus horneckiae]PKG30295.1 recombinase family protein [Cytobacillus horneckiae]